MFQDLDDTLAKLLSNHAADGTDQPPAVVASAMKSFLTPDRNFLTKITGSTALNLFLHKIQENRELRENIGFAEPGDDARTRRLPLLRVDCSYLISAWSVNNNGEEVVRAEHELLGKALQWVSRFNTIPTGFLVGSLNRNDFPLPYTISASLDQAKIPVDFWTGLGIAPRPSFDLVVTIAIDLGAKVDEGPPVTDRDLILGTKDGNKLGKVFEEVHSIGGVVLSAATGQPIPGASVGLADADRTRDVTTGPDGRFLIKGLAPGTYRLRGAATGFATKIKFVDVPVQNRGDTYDLTLT